ncbi:MAG TPA: hypothetical protein PKE39_16370 [Ignavibacteria bacterium]|nr:hypothetical protein [Ignavibacteria bacterium]
MKDTKIVKIFKSFSSTEIKQFEKLLKSPYFSKGRNLLPLFYELKKYYPVFKSNNLKRQEIYKNLFPAEKYNDQKLRVLISELHAMCLEYLIYDQLNKDQHYKNKFLTEALFRKKLFGDLEKQFKVSINFLESGKNDSFEYYLSRFFVERTMCFYTIETNNSIKYPESYMKFSRTFLKSSIIQLLLNYSEMSSYRFNFITDEEKAAHNYLFKAIDFKKIYKLITFDNEDEKKIFGLYYYAYMLIVNKNLSDYYSLKKIFFEIKDKFLTNENRRLIYAKLMNFLSISPDEQFKIEAFELYKKMLEDDEAVMNEGAYFGRTHFRNVLNLAITLGEIQWAENFVNTYKSKLNPAESENMLNFSFGHIYFWKKEFGKSLEYLSKVKFGFATFKEDVNTLTLMNFYELGMYEEALSLADSFKRTFKRTPPMHEVLYTDHKNFLIYYPLLLNARIYSKTDDLTMVENLSEKSVNLKVKKWVEEKIKEIKKHTPAN